MLGLEKLADVTQETMWAVSMVGFVYATGLALTIGLIVLTFLF